VTVTHPTASGRWQAFALAIACADRNRRATVRPLPNRGSGVDCVFLGLKAHSYATTGALLQPLLGSEIALGAAHNGIPWWYSHKVAGPYEGRRIEAVDPGGETSAVMSRNRAIGCVAWPSAIVESPGVIRHLEGRRLSIGEPDGTSSRRCLDFSARMQAGGLKCPVEPRLRDDIWIKLMGNAALNPISASTRATMVEICQHPNTRRVVELMMEETLDIAARLGSHPDISITKRLDSITKRLDGAERVGHHRTSMLQDLEAGRELELDAIVGAVVELADITCADTPTLRTVYAATHLLCQSASQPALTAARA